jgi:hypothetical protein
LSLETDVPPAPRLPDDVGGRLPPLADEPAAPVRAVTWRSVVLGTLAVCLVCGLTPYNDYIVANTFMVGMYLPVVVVLSFFVLTVFVNAPLHRLAPGRALTSGELAVIMAMMLVACGLPTQGLMRAFIPLLVAPFYHGTSDVQFWRAFTAMNLPEWLFPVGNIADGRNSPVMLYFYGRIPDGGPIPWGAWVKPLAGWGVFLTGAFASMMAMAVLVREQWARNERLAFPLAQLELALIEPPKPGRMFNDLFRSRVFWIGLVIVFTVQSLSALHTYFPRSWPEIPLRYDFREIFTEEPLTYINANVKTNVVFFTYLGATYFIQSRIAFSLWSVYLILQVYGMQANAMGYAVPGGAWGDQHFGAAVAFAAGILWIGRHQWARIGRHLVAGAKPGERHNYRAAAVILLASVALMLAWLLLLGVQWWVAGCIVAIVLLVHLVTARVVAETGVAGYRSAPSMLQITSNVPAAALSGRDVFFSGAFSSLGGFTTRESAMTFGLHGLWVADHVEPSIIENRRARRQLMACIAWALALGFVVAAASSLWCYYRYAIPITPYFQNESENPHGLHALPKADIITPMSQHGQGRFPPKAHDPAFNFGLGFALTAALQVLALRYSAWPFMPVGYLFATTAHFPNVGWYSIFLGWLCKVVIVKFGGATLFQRAKPFFIGLIFGEALAAGAWLVVTLVLAWQGLEYRPLTFLPT